MVPSTIPCVTVCSTGALSTAALAALSCTGLNEGVTGAVVEGVLPVLVGELTEVVLFETTAAAGWLGAAT